MATRKKKKARKTTKKPARKAAKKPARKAKKATRKTVKAARKAAEPARTATKRAAPDRSTELRTHSRRRVYSLTREIPEHHYFVLANGKPVKHVAELASILDQLEDHVFQHHVTPDKNDFRAWVHDIFEDVDLARKIAGVNDKRRMQLVIYRHLAGHND